jgi:hypothetical protein
MRGNEPKCNNCNKTSPKAVWHCDNQQCTWVECDDCRLMTCSLMGYSAPLRKGMI